MRKSEKITDKVLKVVERIARNDVEKTILGSTAECSALFHQPKRPKKKENQERNNKSVVRTWNILRFVAQALLNRAVLLSISSPI